MLITLGLILLILIMVVGGDRGVVSLIALCGNLLILSLAIWLMASGVPVLLVTVCVGVSRLPVARQGCKMRPSVR